MILLGLCLIPAVLTAAPDPVAARVDRHLATQWERAGVVPAPLCDDPTFLRRVTLDLIGRIPTVAEVRAFAADESADKRTRAVDRLLASPAHARHFATIWRRTWAPQTEAPAFAALADDFDIWIEARLRARTPYDQLALELLTNRGQAGETPYFRAAAEYKPENLAANTSRVFLGINLDCAQCHDHPFARWKRDEFWQTAAFFARPSAGRLEIAVPSSTRFLSPRLLSGTAPKLAEPISAETGPRTLADWVTAKNNPYFSRNLTNRLWAQLFGIGLVEPLDDLGGDGRPANPLLDELAAAFADGGFDLRSLTRSLVLTRAYQLSTSPAAGLKTGSPQAFAQAAVRGLSGEQLFDSLRAAGGFPTGTMSTRKRFAARFLSERPATADRSVVQALTLMNGSLMADLVSPTKSPILAAADAPFFNDSERVEMLFLAALGRRPTAKEADPLVAHIARAEDRRQALANVFWAILNTTEFATNH